MSWDDEAEQLVSDVRKACGDEAVGKAMLAAYLRVFEIHGESMTICGVPGKVVFGRDTLRFVKAEMRRLLFQSESGDTDEQTP